MAKSTKRKITDDLELYVKSNASGVVFFKNKDEQKWTWEKIGDEHLLTVKDLKEMKASQANFFKQQWISFDEEDKDILDYLRISHFYSEQDDADVDEMLSGDVNDLKLYLDKFRDKDAFRTVASKVVDAAKRMYANGKLKDIHIIEYIEERFNVSIKEQ